MTYRKSHVLLRMVGWHPADTADWRWMPKFHPDPIWRGGALGFLNRIAPRRKTTTSWVSILDQLLIQLWVSFSIWVFCPFVVVSGWRLVAGWAEQRDGTAGRERWDVRAGNEVWTDNRAGNVWCYCLMIGIGFRSMSSFLHTMILIGTCRTLSENSGTRWGWFCMSFWSILCEIYMLLFSFWHCTWDR